MNGSIHVYGLQKGKCFIDACQYGEKKCKINISLLFYGQALKMKTIKGRNLFQERGKIFS